MCQKLKFRFKTADNKLKVIPVDFLKSKLPSYRYKVFSNPPFNITADVVKKLVFADNPPEDIYLVMQKEAADKFMGRFLCGKNSLMSVLISATFELSVFYTFQKTDFFPSPAVHIIMLRLKKSEIPKYQLMT